MQSNGENKVHPSVSEDKAIYKEHSIKLKNTSRSNMGENMNMGNTFCSAMQPCKKLTNIYNTFQ